MCVSFFKYSTPPLLSQESDVDPELFCPEMTEDYILECGEKVAKKPNYLIAI